MDQQFTYNRISCFQSFPASYSASRPPSVPSKPPQKLKCARRSTDFQRVNSHELLRKRHPLGNQPNSNFSRWCVEKQSTEHAGEVTSSGFVHTSKVLRDACKTHNSHNNVVLPNICTSSSFPDTSLQVLVERNSTGEEPFLHRAAQQRHSVLLSDKSNPPVWANWVTDSAGRGVG